MKRWNSVRVLLAALALPLLMPPVGLSLAEIRDQHDAANAARYDMMFGTPHVYTPTAPTNLFATAPGLEQQVRRPQFTISGLVPMFFNSNAEEATTGGTHSAEFTPILGISLSTPV